MTCESIRVLMLDSESSWRGGEAQCQLLMEGLRQRGHVVELAAPAGSAIAERARGAGFHVYPVGFHGGVDLPTAFALRRVIRRGHYHVVHAHASHAHSAMLLACVALPMRPLRVVSRRVDFAVGRGPVAAFKYKQGVDAVLAISTGVQRVLERARVDPGRIRLVPSGIDRSRLEHIGDGRAIRREFGIAEDTPVVGTIAALAPHKAQHDLLDAAQGVIASFPGAHFMIVGDGELREALKKHARRLGIAGSVVFTGNRTDAERFFGVFDVFVISSRLEGLCTSIMDAHTAGVPVAATRTGGIPDLIEDEMTGLLSPPANTSALAANILRLLSDRRLATGCVERAREQSARYDYHSMVYKTEAAYREFLDMSSSGKALDR